MELVLEPLSFVGWFLWAIVKSPLSMHFIISELSLIVGSIWVGQFSIPLFHSPNDIPLKFPAILIVLTNILPNNTLLLFDWRLLMFWDLSAHLYRPLFLLVLVASIGVNNICHIFQLTLFLLLEDIVCCCCCIDSWCVINLLLLLLRVIEIGWRRNTHIVGIIGAASV